MSKLASLGSSLAWLLLLLHAGNARAQVTRGPYLQSLSADRVVVRWQTDLASATDSRVRYGSAPAMLDSSASGTALVSLHDAQRLEHTVVVAGLSAATRHYYDVGTATDGVQAGGTAAHFFDTTPAVGTVSTVNVLVFADSGSGSAEQLAVRDRMQAVLPAPEVVLTLGDIAYDTATSAELTSHFFGVYPNILRHAPVYTAVGNHEASAGSSDSATQTGPYFEAYDLPAAGEAGGLASSTEAYYAFDYGLTHFVVLDSDDSSTTPGSAQLTWLAADLAAVPRSQQWVVVAFHHPPYSKGSHNSDSSSDSGGRMVRMRENVLPLLEAAGVDLVLAGHSHSYERSYLIDGAYGYGTAPSYATPGFSRLDADGHILDAGDGDPAGDGAYHKAGGATAHGGAVYVVAGHGGSATGGAINHPVMARSSLDHGFCRLDIDETTLTLTNIRADGVIVDRVQLEKPAICADASPCDDADPCTDDVCLDQRCHSQPLVCDDGDACTSDACDATGSCTTTPVACGDGDACTADTCDPSSGCEHAAVSCDDADACTSDACDVALGCGHTAVSCDDADACTVDSCSAATGCAHAAVDCDDADACTADACDAATGCAHAAVDCDDADACTADACDAATGCGYAAIDCDDADACTADACDALTGCAHAPIDCDDSDACTADACDALSGCAHAVIDCDDSDACTADACDALSGCAHAAIDCDDSDACTADSCDALTGCAQAAIDCDDSDACTADACDALSGCAHAAVDCDDSDACTADSCDALTGCAHAAIDCDDTDACTADSCDATTGCAHAPIACDAGSPADDASTSSPDPDMDAGGDGTPDRGATTSRPDAMITEGPVAGSDGAPRNDGGSIVAPRDSGTDAAQRDAASDASADAGPGAASSTGCGCRVARGDRPAAWAVLCMLALLASRISRRRGQGQST